MRTIALLTGAWGLSCATLFFTLPASAISPTNERSWVSNNGVSGNPCTEGSPCDTFATALTKTSAGEINCLNSGEYGDGSTLQITQSVTINCAGTLAGITAPTGSPAISINGSGIFVTLRNIVIDGDKVGTDGIDVANANTVVLDTVSIVNFTNRAIFDNSSSATGLGIVNSFIIQNAGPGVVLDGASGSGGAIFNSEIDQNKYGVGVASGNFMTIKNSRANVNVTAGILVTSGGGAYVTGCEILANGTGIDNLGGTVTVNDTDITLNGTAISGPTSSFGNNRIFGNGSAGTTPTHVSTE